MDVGQLPIVNGLMDEWLVRRRMGANGISHCVFHSSPCVPRKFVTGSPVMQAVIHLNISYSASKGQTFGSGQTEHPLPWGKKRLSE